MGVRLPVLLAGVLLVGRVMQAQPSPTEITERLRTTSQRPIDFHAAVYPDTVWVGQQATYQVAVLLNADARSRLRRNPEFLPPELRGLLAYELGAPSRVPPKSYGSDTYEAHVFQRALFPISPGTVSVPSAQLTYSLPQSASYFSREERYSVAAESIQIVVRPLPEAGRPADFAGAIGSLRASVRLDSQPARAGDPLVLTLRVEGIGNVKLLPRPRLELSWASSVAGTERVQVDSSGPFVRGAKEFDYILTPQQGGAAVLPVIRYPYFDPFKGQYLVATTAPVDVRVGDGAMAGPTSPADAEPGDLLPLRPWRATTATGIDRLPAFVRFGALVLVALMPLLAALTWIVGRQRMRRAHTVDAARASERAASVREASDASAGGTARRVRRELLAELARRLQVPPADLVARADVERVLRRRGVTRSTTREILAVLDALAAAGFGGDRTGANDDASLTASAARLSRLVHEEAVPHGRTRLWSRRLRRAGALTAVLLIPWPGPHGGVAGAAGQPSLAGDSTPAESRRDGSRQDGSRRDAEVDQAAAAYNARRFPTAAARFASLVARRPDDVDLLVNWGTAAWAANDTVDAVIAWQRAARLDPFAQDVQERIGLLPAGARVGVADVPMVPVTLLAGVALFAWVAGWATLIVHLRRSGRGGDGLRSVAIACVVVAIVTTAGAWWGERTLSVDRLAVVRRPETLRVAPTADADALGGAATGDVVQILESREGWTHLLHADGRRGWLPAGRLAVLAAPLIAAESAR